MSSQDKINGMIMETNDKNEHTGLLSANIYWQITNKKDLFNYATNTVSHLCYRIV